MHATVESRLIHSLIHSVRRADAAQSSLHLRPHQSWLPEACRRHCSDYRDALIYPLDGLSRVFTTMLSLSLPRFSFTAALILFFAGTLLDAKSVIVDDIDTKVITYSSGWNIGNNCPDCFAQPAESQAYDRTWHEWVWYCHVHNLY